MKQKKIFILLVMSFFSCLLTAQSNYQQFEKLFKAHDTAKIKPFLAEWEKSNPSDPELFTSAFNFYFSQSKQEVLGIEKEQHGSQSIQLTDSTGKVAGFFNSSLSYNPEQLKKAFTWINRGIEKFPTRLDMRFGKCYVLGEIGDWENFTKEIIKTVEYSVEIKNAWLWTADKKLDEPEKFMLRSLHSYLKQLYDTENDDLLENMKGIGDVVIKYYPGNIEILSTTAVAYMLTKSYDKALGYLLSAEKLNPKDYIVLNNIAQGYKLKGDKANAIKYYELTQKYGDAQAKEQAKEELKKLKQ